MKRNFKIISSLLCLGALVSLGATSCQGGGIPVDSDYDGLPDNIDPAPHDNKYQITLVKEDEDGAKEESNPLTVAVDYRDFLKSGYQHNLGLLSSFFVNELSGSFKPLVKNNVYPKTATEESKISPLLAQIGAKDIATIEISKNTYTTDPYDVANITMGHHTFAFNNQRYQIYFALIIPYPNRSGWVSNFDLGGVDEQGNYTNEYKKLEGDNHPDWTNRAVDHKGFSVTSNRVIDAINRYENNHLDKAAKIITLVTGHSRGGAIANLVGKNFVDNNKKVRAYCFNPANTTLSIDAKKESYNSSIFNIINDGDLVSRIPAWGFKLYGKDMTFTIDKQVYQNFMKKEYEGNSKDGVDAVTVLLNKMLTKDGNTSRNNYYEFRDKSTEYPEKWSGSKEEMEKLHKKLPTFFKAGSYASQCFKYGAVTKGESDYYIEYEIRPAIIKSLLVDILAKNDFANIISYHQTLSRIISEFLDVYLSLDDEDFTFSGIVNAHLFPIACVMAEQHHE